LVKNFVRLSGWCLTGPYAYRDKKVVGVFVRFSCAATVVFPIGKGTAFRSLTLTITRPDGSATTYTAEQVRAIRVRSCRPLILIGGARFHARFSFIVHALSSSDAQPAAPAAGRSASAPTTE
jgi:hypothetical protein